MKFFFLLEIFSFIFFKTSSFFLNSSMTVGKDYKLKIYEHAKCEFKDCVQILFPQDLKDYNECLRSYNYCKINGIYQFEFDEDFCQVICMFTRDAKRISNILSKGSSGIYGCFLDYFNQVLSALYIYQRFISKYHFYASIDYLYFGTELQRAKNYGFIDGSQCLLKKGDNIYEYITFTSYGSTSTNKRVATNFAIDKDKKGVKGGIVITIKTLKEKSKAISIGYFSNFIGEEEFVFPPGSKFKVISDCKRKFIDSFVLYEVEVEELDGVESDFYYLPEIYEAQEIDPNENEIKKYTKFCTKCNEEVHDFCKYCNSPNECSECYAGYITNRNGKCVKCKNECLKCNEENLNSCTKCFNGYGLIGQECKKCKINDCLNCDGNVEICKECKKGYFLDNVICKPISLSCDKYIFNCAECNYDNLSIECQSCIEGYILVDNKCEVCDNQRFCKECKMENGVKKCLSCFPGSGLINDECQKCEDGCNECIFDKDGNQECLSCTIKYTNGEAYYMDENKKCKKCPDNCEKCVLYSGKINCLQCNILNSYLDSNGECKRCNETIEGCEQCDYDENKTLICNKCEENYALKKGECKICQIENCLLCEIDNDQEICLNCGEKNNMNNIQMFGTERYGLKDGKCFECGSNSCKSCIYNKDINIMECANNNSSKYESIKIIMLLIFIFII